MTSLSYNAMLQHLDGMEVTRRYIANSMLCDVTFLVACPKCVCHAGASNEKAWQGVGGPVGSYCRRCGREKQGPMSEAIQDIAVHIQGKAGQLRLELCLTCVMTAAAFRHVLSVSELQAT